MWLCVCLYNSVKCETGAQKSRRNKMYRCMEIQNLILHGKVNKTVKIYTDPQPASNLCFGCGSGSVRVIQLGQQ